MNEVTGILRTCGYGLFVSLIFFLCGVVSLPAQEPQENDLEYNPTGALIRSAVVPGWGQFYTKHYLKSAGFFAAHAYFAFRFYQEHEQLDGMTGEQAREQQEYHRNTWAWRFLIAYVLNLTDAYVDAHLSGFPKETESLSVDMRPVRDGLSLQLEFTW